MRALGLDVSDRRIGLALSDETGLLASPLATLARVSPRRDANTVVALARQHEVGTIVVGLPLHLDGRVGPQAQKILAFVAALRARTRVPVVTQDERLTTVEAEQILSTSRRSRAARQTIVDQVAAVVILQEYLDHQRQAATLAAASAVC
jgi:putative Holliday junction resolvase